jgi:hypothetical protein
VLSLALPPAADAVADRSHIGTCGEDSVEARSEVLRRAAVSQFDLADEVGADEHDSSERGL